MSMGRLIEMGKTGEGRKERMLREILSLSTKEKVQFFAHWMAEEDGRLKMALFAAWMRAERDRKLKRTLFVSWMKAEKEDKKFLRDIADKAATVYVTGGFAKRDYAEIEHWIEAAINNEKSRTADEIAHTCKNKFGLSEKMIPLLKKIIRIKKENKRLRERKRRMSATGGSRPGQDQPSAFRRLLAEATYSVPVSLAEKEGLDRTRPIVQPTLPGALDGEASLDSKRRIEDYEALIAPYRNLLAEIASLETLDELLRILYEEGDVPSVVLGQGKTYDGEYKKLRGHSQFLKILQGVSLYDHTYNVLKAALDITRDDLRQRYDLLLPSIITAALAHDLGKVRSLWSSSPARKYGHEWVGMDRLKKMLVSHRNEAFIESVLAAVKYHHTNSTTDTIARIVMDADAKGREREITSADPTITLKPMAEWLDVTRFAEIMLPAINKLTIKNHKAIWNPMSFRGVVYCMPNYIQKVLMILAIEKRVFA